MLQAHSKANRVQQAKAVPLMQLKNQQQSFMSSPVTSKDPIWVPQSAFPKQMWRAAPVKFLLLGCSGAWSGVWTKLLLRQTNSCLAQGRGNGAGVGRRRAPPFSSTHSPSPHPAVPLHLWPHPLTQLLFYVHFDFLPSLSSRLGKEVFYHSTRRTLQNRVKVCIHHFPFIQCCIFNASSRSLTKYVALYIAKIFLLIKY